MSVVLFFFNIALYKSQPSFYVCGDNKVHDLMA